MRKVVLFVALTVFWLSFVFSAIVSLKSAARNEMPNLYFENTDKWYVRGVEDGGT